MFWTANIFLFSLCCKLATCNSTPVIGSNLTFRSVAYYANWAIYNRKFNPQDLPFDARPICLCQQKAWHRRVRFQSFTANTVNYAGSWSTLASHQANLFKSMRNPAATPFDTQTAIEYYISQNISSDKLVLGVPVYSRSFSATDGLGKPFNRAGKGSWEAGIYDYKDFPLRGAVEKYDNASGSSYSYDSTTRELISYDTILAGKQKAIWIQQRKLGGIVWWEGSADGLGDKSLIQNTVQVLGGKDTLSVVPNELVYLHSVYDNLRVGMPGEDGDPAQQPTTNSTTSSASSSTDPSTILKDDPALATTGENLGDSVLIIYTTITIILPATPVLVTSVVIVTV